MQSHVVSKRSLGAVAFVFENMMRVCSTCNPFQSPSCSNVVLISANLSCAARIKACCPSLQCASMSSRRSVLRHKSVTQLAALHLHMQMQLSCSTARLGRTSALHAGAALPLVRDICSLPLQGLLSRGICDQAGWRAIPLGRNSSHGLGGQGHAGKKGEGFTTTDDTEAPLWKRFLHGRSRQSERQDFGDWNLSPEWWGTQGGGWGHDEGAIIFEQQSGMGNGVICVTAHPASTPTVQDGEKELQRILQWSTGLSRDSLPFRIVGYEWRVLRFNNITRQSVAKVVVLSRRSNPEQLLVLQLPDCLAFEYLKTMVSAGLSAVSLAGLDLPAVRRASQQMRILCIGLGGGSLPLYLAHNLPGSTVEAVEIDKVVISAAIDAMGYPPCLSSLQQVGVRGNEIHDTSTPPVENMVATEEEVDVHSLWAQMLDRMLLYEADGVDFVCNMKGPAVYDLVFIDAYDGKDEVPHALWDVDGPFLHSLKQRLHPRHGTVVVNLHSDSPPPAVHEKLTGKYGPGFDPSRPQGKKVRDTCLAYRNAVLATHEGDTRSRSKQEDDVEGIAFTVAVPWQQNIALVVSRGGLSNGDPGTNAGGQKGGMSVKHQDFLKALQSEGHLVQQVLGSTINFRKRVARGFHPVA